MERVQFDKIWDQRIKNELHTLEPLQKEERRAQILGLIIGLAAGVVALIMFSANATWSSMSNFLEISLIITLVVGAIAYFNLRPAHFSQIYKTTVIDALSRLTRLSWRYISTTPVDRSISALDGIANFWRRNNHPFGGIYAESGLYGTAATSISPGDMFISEHAGHALVEVTATRGSGKSKQTLFSGIIFRFEVGHPFASETYIREEKWGDGAVGTGETRGIRVASLEWPEFKKLFEVETTSEVEVREILDPQFMETLHAWWLENKTSIRLAFKDRYMYLSVPVADLFEPRPFSSIESHKEELWKYLKVFQLADSLFQSYRV